MNEAEALELIRQRKDLDRGFGAVAELYGDDLLALLYHLCGNRADAEDLRQETLAAAWVALPRLKLNPGVSLRAWLRAVGRRQWYRLRRKRRREAHCRYHVQLCADPTVPGPAEEYRARAKREWTWSLVRKLDFEEQAVVVMHRMECRTIAETAEALGLPVGTVKGILHRAEQKLRLLARVVTP
jgi:RNA polymerase sigma-70 factor (ECF subfamily)